MHKTMWLFVAFLLTSAFLFAAYQSINPSGAIAESGACQGGRYSGGQPRFLFAVHTQRALSLCPLEDDSATRLWGK